MTDELHESDRLFAEGCCLCGSPYERLAIPFGDTGTLSYGRENANARVCQECMAPHAGTGATWKAGFAWADAEITRRKRLSRPLPPATSFKVGDWVEYTTGDGHRNVGRMNPDRYPGDPFAQVTRLADGHGVLVLKCDLRPWRPSPDEWCEGERFTGEEIVAGKFAGFECDGDAKLQTENGDYKDCKPASLRPAVPIRPRPERNGEVPCTGCGKGVKGTSMKKNGSSDRPVIITTLHRGVFFGYASRRATDAWEKSPEKVTVKIARARCCLYWSQDVKGFMGLAANGPTKSCRVGPAADIVLRNVTAILDVSADAAKAWEAQPWG